MSLSLAIDFDHFHLDSKGHLRFGGIAHRTQLCILDKHSTTTLNPQLQKRAFPALPIVLKQKMDCLQPYLEWL